MPGQNTTTFAKTGQTQTGRVLDPLERSSEIMFGLIMALTFTCSVSVASSTPDVRTMLVSALGCNVAWGVIDAAMYLLAEMVTRQRQRIFAIAIADASPAEARRMILERMPDGLERHLSADELDRLANGVRSLPPPSQSLLPHPDDLRGATGIFLLVFLHVSRRTPLPPDLKRLHCPAHVQRNRRRLALPSWDATRSLYEVAVAMGCWSRDCVVWRDPCGDRDCTWRMKFA